MLGSGSFPLTWETGRAKCVFPALKVPPYRRQERTILAKSMSFEQILDTSVFVEDGESKRRLRWKAARQLFHVTQSAEYCKHSFSRPLYGLGSDRVSPDHVVAAIMNEYRFPTALRMDALLRWLCWSFDKERSGTVEWRNILLFHEILLYFRWVRDRTAELLLILFSIFCEGAQGSTANKDDFILMNADHNLRTIFLAPCVTDSQVSAMTTLCDDFCIFSKKTNNFVRRNDLKRLLIIPPGSHLVALWGRFMWELLPSDLRLTALDEAQLRHKAGFDNIFARFQFGQALAMHFRNTQKLFFREWHLYVLRSTGVRSYHVRKTRRKVLRFFQFWRKLSRRMTIRRQRRALATAMGTFALKARCFLRLRLALQNRQKIENVIGTVHRRVRYFRLAGTHIREYRRMHWLRKFYHRWWNACVRMNNMEVAKEANARRLLRKVLLPWHDYACTRAAEERAEIQARENKLQMDRLLQQAEDATNELLRLEKQRDERKRAVELEAAKLEKARRLEQAKERIQKEKRDEREILLKIQREERVKRVAEDLKRLKSSFKKEFAQRAKDLLAKARERTTAYIENPDNKLALDLKAEKLKREFFANPSPETKERERILSSYRNILFLYIEAKLRVDGMELEDLVPRFDVGRKGYLTYEEFSSMIRSLKTSLSEAQILNVIRAVDSDKGGYIEISELYDAMREIEQMGVPGSPWKLYIDPAEDVICYHNFLTGEKIPEFKMTDQTLRVISLSNLYGEAEITTLQEIKALRSSSWQETLQSYMARRMQYMFRQWKARKWRQKRAWKVEKRQLRAKTELQRTCVRFIEKCYLGRKCRTIFRKQLWLTVEKVYDTESAQLFYFNHATQISTWEMPWLLRRHGDVTQPWPWIPLEQSSESHVGSNDTIHYWHVTAKREFPKKPDGYSLCGNCQYLLAIHQCKDCGVNYCFRCHRATHANPAGFVQKTKLRKEEYSDPDFVLRTRNFEHSWTKVELLKCQLCKTSKIYAAYHCDDCDKNLCRQCFHRLHPKDAKTSHSFRDV